MEIMLIDFCDLSYCDGHVIMCFAISYIDFKEASKWKNSK